MFFHSKWPMHVNLMGAGLKKNYCCPFVVICFTILILRKPEKCFQRTIINLTELVHTFVKLISVETFSSLESSQLFKWITDDLRSANCGMVHLVVTLMDWASKKLFLQYWGHCGTLGSTWDLDSPLVGYFSVALIIGSVIRKTFYQ